jgi:hypothetical protein
MSRIMDALVYVFHVCALVFKFKKYLHSYALNYVINIGLL